MGTVTCRNCGGPTPVSAIGEPRVYCDKPECLRARQLYPGQVSAARKIARSAARKSKVCPVCGKRKPLTVKYWGPRSDRGWQPYCIPCHRADGRGRYATSASRRAAQKDRAKGQRAAIAERRASDPEFDRAWRKQAREWSAKARKRKREGVTVASTENELPRLPAKPVAEYVDKLIAQRRVGHSDAAEIVCESLKIEQRSLWAWRNGERDTIQFDTVDRILIGCGALWFDIYDPDHWPEEHKLAEAVFDPELGEMSEDAA